MTKKEHAERVSKALDEFLALPVDEWLRIMVANGTINEQGEVLMGLKEAKEHEARENNQSSSQNGTLSFDSTESRPGEESPL